MKGSLCAAQVVRPWEEITFPEFRKQAREAARIAAIMMNNDMGGEISRHPRGNNNNGEEYRPNVGNDNTGNRNFHPQQERHRGLGQQQFRSNNPMQTNRNIPDNRPRNEGYRSQPVGHQVGFRGVPPEQGITPGEQSSGRCGNCSIFGHHRRDCRIPEEKVRKFMEAERTGIAVIEYEDQAALEREKQGCFYCKELGHLARSCMKNPQREL
jgi:hypothetical protein